MLLFCGIQYQNDDKPIYQNSWQVKDVFYALDDCDCDEKHKGKNKEPFVEVLDCKKCTLILSEKSMTFHQLIFDGVVSRPLPEEQSIEYKHCNEYESEDSLNQRQLQISDEHLNSIFSYFKYLYRKEFHFNLQSNRTLKVISFCILRFKLESYRK